MGQHEAEPVDSDFGQMEAPAGEGLSEVREMTPEETRLHELEYMIFLQGNTIQAFQQRVYKLEMEIVELISGATHLQTPDQNAHPH
jgi:hypothetical protein